MENPIHFIEKIKCSLEEVLIDEEINYLGENAGDILNVYSADFCEIMLKRYPGATIMMHKSFRKCGIMIQGVIYDSYGIDGSKNYFVAGTEDVNFIQKSFKQLSDDVIGKLTSKVFGDEKDSSLVFSLRKNREGLT